MHSSRLRETPSNEATFFQRRLRMICNTHLPEHRRRATVALGGGGARGLAHLGALQAIEESEVCLERIVGVSIGSLVGGLCACGNSTREVQQHVLTYVQSSEFVSKQAALFGAHPKSEMSTGGMLAWYDRIRAYLWASQLLNRIFRKPSLLPGRVLEEVIATLVPDIDIGDTHIPLSIVSIDLITGHQVVLERGSLRKAILASAAIPGIFPPVPWEGMLLSDIGVLDSLPSKVARSYNSDLVIGIDIGPRMERMQRCDSALHALLRMDEIAERLVRRYAWQSVDLLIRPEVGHYQWFDFTDPHRLVQLGLEAGRDSLESYLAANPIPRWDSKDSECQSLGCSSRLKHAI